jgi:uncharacterized membrane protein YuzA (DUF378 family)
VPIQTPAQDYGLQAPVPVQTPTNSLFAELLDEAGMASAHKGEQECPSCRKPMPRGAILCIKCGYHLQHRVKVQGVAEKGETDAHGDVANTVLSNAAKALDKDKEDIKKETGEGWPWYAIAAMLVGVIGFIVAMLMLPPQTAFVSAGYTLIGLGMLICFYSWVMVMINAQKESMTQALLCFFVPLYILVYVIMRWDRNGGFFFMYLGGIAVQVAGQGMIILAPMMKREGEEDDAHRFERNRPAIVQLRDFTTGRTMLLASELRADCKSVEFA